MHRTVLYQFVGGALVVGFMCAAVGAVLIPRASFNQSAKTPGFEGPGVTALPDVPAPPFALRDQRGSSVSLQSERGYAVVLSFMYTDCPDTCPQTAQKLRTVLTRFGREARQVRVLIVSVDPLHDDATDARNFLVKHGLPQWHFLLGGYRLAGIANIAKSYRKLAQVWKEYGIYVPNLSAERNQGQGHSAFTYLIDKHGREVAILPDTTPSPDFAQDLHILLDDHHWTAHLTTGSAVGEVAPAFRLRSTNGQFIQVRSLVGHPLLLNFWATWCPACRSETRTLERLYRRYRGKVAVVGIDEQEPLGEVASFMRQFRVTYPTVLDADGTAMFDYQVPGTPTTFFLDSHGVIRSVTVGALKESEATRQIQLLLRHRPAVAI